MILTTDQTNAANAAITNLQAANAAYEAIGDQWAKYSYASASISPLIQSSLALAISLGNQLLTQWKAALDSAISPYHPNDFTRTQAINQFSAILGLYGQIAELNSQVPIAILEPSGAYGHGRTMIAVFQAILNDVSAEASAQAAIVDAAVAAAQAAIGASSAQPVIVGDAVQAALQASGVSSTEATAAGAAVQAALAA